MSSTSLSSMPRARNALRIALMSSTTKWRPLIEPGVMSDRSHSGPEDNGAARSRRCQLDHPHRLGDLGVVDVAEPDLFVKGFGTFDVGDGDRDEFETHLGHLR